MHKVAQKMLAAIEREVGNNEKEYPSIGPPANTELPLLAYGCFKPGELGWPQIEDLCEAEEVELTGYGIRRRDGLALLVKAPDHHALAFLLTPRADTATTLYDKVGDYEPKHQYEWAEIEVAGTKANVLVGVLPDNGSEPGLYRSWSAGDDPAFVEGLPTVRRLYRRSRRPPERGAGSDGSTRTDLYTLEAAYLLLWSIAERYAALRVGPHLGPEARLRALQRTGDFQDAVARWVHVDSSMHTVCDSRNPDAVIHMGEQGDNAAAYWYTLRCNLSHRGKSSYSSDEMRLEQATRELHDVLSDLLLAQYPEIVDRWNEFWLTDPRRRHRKPHHTPTRPTA